MRWYLANGTENDDYLELRASGASPTKGVSFVYHDSDGNTNTFYSVMDQNGNFSLAKKSHASSDNTFGVGTAGSFGHCKVINNLTTGSYADGQALAANQGKILNDKISNLDAAACKAYHWSNGTAASAPYYKVLCIKYSGGAYGTNPFLVDVGGNIYLICAPEAKSSFQNCTWKEIVTGNDAINPSEVACIVDGSLSRIKITFASTINPGCNIVPLCPETAVTQVYTATS